MSDEPLFAQADGRVEEFSRQFRQLSPGDQALVMALISRLGDIDAPAFPPDVPFMDFDE